MRPRPADPRGVAADETLVQTHGAARAESRPDEARFSAGVSSIGATGPAAGEANARKMTAVVAAITALGVAERDIQTRQLSLGRIDYGANRGRFEASNVVAVRVRDLVRAGRVIAAATGAGANILSGPDLRVADPATATRAAYGQAYRAARLRADAYAAAAGLKVTRVLAIRDAASPMSPYGRVTDMAAPAPVVAQSVAPVLPGTNEQEVAVTAEFALAK